jgi:tetratricopeptide (TPR) repeat protein
MGYLALALFGAGAFAAMAMLGVRRPLWSLAGAALMLGAIGYALQGRPMLAASPAQPQAAVAPPDQGLIDLRDRMLGRFTADWSYLVAADAMERAGEPALAVRAILGGIQQIPNSLELWIGLGDALAAHDGGKVSPPALFAFQRAMRLAPDHPAPPFFLGIAYVRAGDFAAARPLWARALALTPKAVSYRAQIAERLALLDRYLAEAETGAPPSAR